ncbi:MAG TPA: phage antirepressor KilAC domain-containing protein [Corynebacterium glutamicum]|nr:phage antirepressor KilAC domain-containing protein [Corynebacterium glutamicum]
MSNLQSLRVSPFEAIKQVRADGSEFWSACDLMPMLGYDRWENFSAALDRAKIAAEAQGHKIEDLFRGVTKKGGGRPQQDFELARFAAYLVAMNGDPRKPEIAAAQAYFAIQTHIAETQPVAPAIPQTYAEALREAASQAERAELEQKRAEKAEHTLEIQAPKVAKADAHSASKEWKGRQEFAREIQKWGLGWGYKINQVSVHELLRRKGMFVSGDRRDRNHATAHAEKSGWATTEKGVSKKTGKPFATSRISPKGQDLAWKWANKALEEYGETLNPLIEEKKSA